MFLHTFTIVFMSSILSIKVFDTVLDENDPSISSKRFTRFQQKKKVFPKSDLFIFDIIIYM